MNTKLTLSYVNSCFRYEYKTGLLFWKKRGPGRRMGQQVGTVDAYGYRVVGLDRRIFKVHRIIWLLITGNLPDNEIDHKNGKVSDNRISNLRKATHLENMRNRKLHKNSRSKITGVYFNKHSMKWESYIRLNKKLKCLGFFDSVDKASLIRQKAEKKYFGKFIR